MPSLLTKTKWTCASAIISLLFVIIWFIKKDVFESLGSGKLSIIGEWCINNFTLIGYGFSEGEEENNHELPPPVSDNEIFVDILVAKTNNKKQILGMNTENYEEIYTRTAK